MAKENNVRNKANTQINKGVIASAAIDTLTLKRMHPNRFLSEIVETEGYVEVSRNKWKKRSENGEQYPL